MVEMRKHVRITGGARRSIAADLRTKYELGASIRSLAESSGRSYGFVHSVLAESGVVMRSRGGARPNRKRRGHAR